MKPFIDYDGVSLLFAAAILLVLPLQWVAAVFIAALFHELCHYFAIRLTGGGVCGISVTPRGAVMETGVLSSRQELFCALVGPAGSLLLFLCYPWIPRIALCAGIHGAFNLIPVYPLDGGRAFRILTGLCFPEAVASAVCRGVEMLLGLLILIAGLYCAFWLKLGISPLIFSFLLLFRVLSEKFLANRENCEYNSATKYDLR